MQGKKFQGSTKNAEIKGIKLLGNEGINLLCKNELEVKIIEKG